MLVFEGVEGVAVVAAEAVAVVAAVLSAGGVAGGLFGLLLQEDDTMMKGTMIGRMIG